MKGYSCIGGKNNDNVPHVFKANGQYILLVLVFLLNLSLHEMVSENRYIFIYRMFRMTKSMVTKFYLALS